jgi:hypothetical protein
MASSNSNAARALTSGEAFILAQIQDMHGAQNSTDQVFFSDRDEAVLFVTDKVGIRGLMIVLTNLSRWMDDGTIASVTELREKWLVPGNV